MGLDLGEPQGNEPLAALNALARQARDGVVAPTPAEQRDGWVRVAARVRVEQAGRTRAIRYAAAGLVTAAVVAVLVLVPSLRARLGSTPAPLAYQIRGGSVVDGGYLRESGSQGITVRFAEGTEMAFLPGARGRVRSVSERGARIAIEHGAASFHVVPRDGADWSVEVGPFVVTVKGTAFTLAWDVVTERFDLVLEHGAVSVAGPMSGGTVLLREGQRLAVDLPGKRTTITEKTADGSWPVIATGAPAAGAPDRGEPSTEPAAAETPPSAAPAPGERAVSANRPGTRRGWAQAVATGDWDRILADADRAGIKETLAHASSDDLLALADAARYRRRGDLARAALIAERRRFPSSASALEAAYLLGRLAESKQGGAREALRWYDTYLEGAASGPYASEALGRKMMAVNELHGAGEARTLAQEYLRRFPGGSYGGAARALLSSSP